MTSAGTAQSSAVAALSAGFEDLLAVLPEWATELGDHRYDDRLTDLSEAGLARLRATAARHRDALDDLALDTIPAPEAVDVDILRNRLDVVLLELDVLRSHTWNPLDWLPGEALFPLLTHEAVPAAERLRALAARLVQIPDRLAEARRVVRRPPRIHLETAVERTGGVLSLVSDELSRLLAQEPGLRPLVEPAQARAVSALVEHRSALAEQLATADGDPRLGAAAFAAKLHLTFDADLSAEQVLASAWDHLALVEQQLAEVAGCAVRAALDACATDGPDDSSVVAVATRALAEVTAATRRLGFVTVPDDPCEVVVMPVFRRGTAGAYCDPPPPLELGGVTRYAVAPTPQEWSAARKASFYREYNAAMMVNLSVHEGVPGHALQLAHHRRYHGSTPVRTALRSGPFVEGWAVHAERLLAEAGHGGRPLRLQQLKMQLRMTINAILDAGVHAGGMSEAEAMDLMLRRGHQEEGEAVAKWRRALLTSAQLSTYFVGYLELEPVLAAVPGGERRYDAVLAYGSPPPRHLPRLLVGSGPPS